MPVDIEHPEYTKYKGKWQRILDCLEGSDAVKAGGYVPMLEALEADKAHGMRRMQKYVNRGVFSNATDRTASALVGAIFRKEPDFEVPARLMPRMDNINGAGDPIFTFAKHVVRHVLTLGRFGLFVDWPEEGEDLLPFMTGYDALAIRSWRTRNVGGRPKLDQVILYEEISIPALDGFGSELSPQYRVLELDEAGMYQQRLFTKQAITEGRRGGARRNEAQVTQWVERVIESKPDKGKAIDYIPFRFLSPDDLRESVSKPPFLDLADQNIAHFIGSVALEHGRFYTAHGTPVITGYAKPEDDDPWDYGPENIWFIPEVGAKVEILQFNSNGLQHLENGQTEKLQQMSFLGARLMETQKRAVEAAETHMIRQSSESGVLAGTANVVSEGFEWCLDRMAEWSRAPTGCTFQLNTDFYDKPMEPTLMANAMAGVQSGLYPMSAWLWFLKESEMLPPDMTTEEAQNELDQQGPLITARNMTLPDEDETEDGDDRVSNSEEEPGGTTRDEEGGRSGDQAAAGGTTRRTNTAAANTPTRTPTRTR